MAPRVPAEVGACRADAQVRGGAGDGRATVGVMGHGLWDTAVVQVVQCPVAYRSGPRRGRAFVKPWGSRRCRTWTMWSTNDTSVSTAAVGRPVNQSSRWEVVAQPQPVVVHPQPQPLHVVVGGLHPQPHPQPVHILGLAVHTPGPGVHRHVGPESDRRRCAGCTGSHGRTDRGARGDRPAHAGLVDDHVMPSPVGVNHHECAARRAGQLVPGQGTTLP